MAAETECPLTITWETLPPEQQPRAILEYAIDSAYLSATDSWSVTVYDDDPARLENLALEPVTLAIHGAPQLLGRVEQIQRGRVGNAVTISGRDHLAALVEGNIDPTVKITADNTLAQAVLLAAGPYGITTVFGEDDVQLRNLRSGASPAKGVDPGFADLQPGDLKPEAGMGVFDWLNRLCARHGCTIQPGPSRDSVVLASPNYVQSPVFTVYRSKTAPPAGRNNVVKATSDENYSQFPTVGLSTGKVTSTGKASQTASTEYDVGAVISGAAPELFAKLDGKMLSQRIKPTDAPGDPLKLYRLLYVKDDQSRKAEQVERAITRAVSERLRETLEYTIQAKGHRDPDTGAIYSVDTQCQVTDEVCGIEETLWICSRRLSFAPGSGAVSDVVMWRPGSLVL